MLSLGFSSFLKMKSLSNSKLTYERDLFSNFNSYILESSFIKVKILSSIERLMTLGASIKFTFDLLKKEKLDLFLFKYSSKLLIELYSKKNLWLCLIFAVSSTIFGISICVWIILDGKSLFEIKYSDLSVSLNFL